MIKELLKETRSYRRYDQSRRVSREVLTDIAQAVRYCPSAANLQRIRLCLVDGEEKCERIFENLSFAALLRPWERPDEGEKPTAYVVLAVADELDVNLSCDVGIAAEALMLCARERGLAGCMFRSFNKEKLTRILGKEPYYPALVISLGYPGETVVLEDAKDGNLKYYRDEDGVHHVPKLPLEEIIL